MKQNGVIVLRPEKGSSLKEDLEKLAVKKKWSVNKLATFVLAAYVKGKKK